MAESTTDPLERAVLSGTLFAGPDPEGHEPVRSSEGYKDEDGDGDRDGAHSDGIGFVPPPEAAPPSSSQAPPAHTSKGRSHNTGVKGVLADYRNRNNRTHPHPEGGGMENPGISKETLAKFTNMYLQARDGRQTAPGPGHPDDQEDSDDGLSDLDGGGSEDEREAREAYRKARMREIMKMGSGERKDVKAGNAAAHLPRFGHLREIGEHQFVKATEEKAGVVVLVHVYDAVSAGVFIRVARIHATGS